MTVKEAEVDLLCSTRTELELIQALRRRALAFDLVGLCRYSIMNTYHADLCLHLQEEAPSGYARVSVEQVLRTDQAVFSRLAETLTTLKKNAAGECPFENALKNVLGHPSVAFHLLPMAVKTTSSAIPVHKDHLKKPGTPPPPPAAKKVAGKAKGKGKGRGKTRGRGPNVPKPLIGKAMETSSGERLCWPFNMSSGCPDAVSGKACSRGLHLCAEPGCQKAHSLVNHS